jgi:excisionase family DNA binding protein
MTAATRTRTTEMPPPRPTGDAPEPAPSMPIAHHTGRSAGGISLTHPSAEAAPWPCSHGAIAVYTLDEAATVLRVKPSWLERRAAARDIPFTMLGGSYRFTADHLAAIVTQHENRPAPPERDATVSRPAVARRPLGTPRPDDLQARPLRPRPRPRRAA